MALVQHLVVSYAILQVLLCQCQLAASCSTVTILSASEGTVDSHPNVGSQYDNNLNKCWLIRTDMAVEIKFSWFDVESCCDGVRIYGNSESPAAGKEVFHLTTEDVVQSDFWLANTTLVQFTTDGSEQRTGFSFTYKLHPWASVPEVPTAAELIRASVGSRSSHVRFGKDNYPDSSTMRAWSIHAEPHQLVTLRFSTFETEACCDVLAAFLGTFPSRMNRTMVWNMTGGPFKDISHQFLGNVTLIFRTDSSVAKAGFNFEFTVVDSIYRMSADFRGNWSGRIAGQSGLTLQVQPSNLQQSTRCRAQRSCGNDSATGLVPSNLSDYPKKLQFSNPEGGLTDSSSFCISEVTCTAQGKIAGALGTFEQVLQLPTADPESVRIELMSPESWSLTGVTQFRAVSEAACPSVRHRCELRTANGSSLTAQPIRLEVSPPSQPLCLSSVMTQFALVTQPSVTAGSVVACRLLGGGFEERQLPLLAAYSGLAKPWEPPLLIAASVTAVLALLALSAIGCVVAMRMRRRAGSGKTEMAVAMMRQTSANGNPYVAGSAAADNQVCEIYAS